MKIKLLKIFLVRRIYEIHYSHSSLVYPPGYVLASSVGADLFAATFLVDLVAL